MFKFYAGGGTDAAYTDVQSGNLDVLDQVPPSALTTFESDDKVAAYNEPGSSFSSLTIPERLAHFEGEEGKLRRAAISMAINRPEITEKIFNNARTPAKDFTSPVLDGWTEDVEGNDVLTFNAEEAKKKWAEADAIDEVGRQVRRRLQRRRRRQQGVHRGDDQPGQERPGHRR